MQTIGQMLKKRDAKQFKSRQFTILAALRFELQWLAQQARLGRDT